MGTRPLAAPPSARGPAARDGSAIGLDHALAAVRAVVDAAAERDADPRPRPRDLRDAVVPRPLRRAAGDEQVAAPEEDGDRAAGALRAEQELPRLAERDEGDDG